MKNCHIVSAFYKGYVNDREKKNYIATGTNVKSIYGAKRVPSEGVKQLAQLQHDTNLMGRENMRLFDK